MSTISKETLYKTIFAGAVWGAIVATVATADIDWNDIFGRTASEMRMEAIQRGIHRAQDNPISKDQMLPVDPFAYRL